MNPERVRDLIKQLFQISRQLEKETHRKGLMPSGQQLGNLGEILLADRFGLELAKPMTVGIDACTSNGDRVQIKTTTERGRGIPLCHEKPDDDIHLLAALIKSDGSFDVIFNGPMIFAWEIRQKTPKSTGIYFASMGPLLRKAKTVPMEFRLTAVSND
tara:strand:+ start:529 stop:1002 length:474 start_codon:yes stop_codon:yes gene_type:complete